VACRGADTNSYSPACVPGYEAPIHLVYSQRIRSACIRIPTYSNSPKPADGIPRSGPSCNPYLASPAM